MFVDAGEDLGTGEQLVDVVVVACSADRRVGIGGGVRCVEQHELLHQRAPWGEHPNEDGLGLGFPRDLVSGVEGEERRDRKRCGRERAASGAELEEYPAVRPPTLALASGR